MPIATHYFTTGSDFHFKYAILFIHFNEEINLVIKKNNNIPFVKITLFHPTGFEKKLTQGCFYILSLYCLIIFILYGKMFTKMLMHE